MNIYQISCNIKKLISKRKNWGKFSKFTPIVQTRRDICKKNGFFKTFIEKLQINANLKQTLKVQELVDSVYRKSFRVSKIVKNA